ncbi:beta-N-acetylhexosaminidase [Mycobacterium sp. KBS0706]|uniref:beta-N-acetylhexosaminidase n=1 Tax=Mycobacterium sp. KBS0706 TaxID=2578109 RepID=UPI00110FD0EF|nr:beta-N-acetylhexosaminidase [Mycobacterium sp. KBS0706]TSD88169.1 beta-N-acetylhexosaminidase [Mycobacterium sp. KBS0706]
MPKAILFGCAGPILAAEERLFFRDADPLGFILFRRNCETPDQLAALVADLRDAVGREAPVMIDQEGGRVARLRPPHWPAFPAAGRFGALDALDPAAAEKAARANATAIALTTGAAGIDIVAAPVLDLDLPGADRTVVGDRAFSGDPAVVARLGRAVAEGLLDGGALPVIKHLPGHGRSKVDSHFALPLVEADLDTLERTDFAPFRDLSDLPWGMTGHLVFTALDPDHPVTQSPTAIRDAVRGRIGFGGVLCSDDLSMGALSGTLPDRAARALAAGCDLALHCNGDLAEMRAIAAAVPAIGPETSVRLARAEAWRRPASERPVESYLERVKELLDLPTA